MGFVSNLPTRSQCTLSLPPGVAEKGCIGNKWVITRNLSSLMIYILNNTSTSIYLLLVQIQQWKHHNNVWNLFRVNNKENRVTDVNGIVLVSLLLTLKILRGRGLLFLSFPLLKHTRMRFYLVGTPISIQCCASHRNQSFVFQFKTMTAFFMKHWTEMS